MFRLYASFRALYVRLVGLRNGVRTKFMELSGTPLMVFHKGTAHAVEVTHEFRELILLFAPLASPRG
jgi:hypothetical protein